MGTGRLNILSLCVTKYNLKEEEVKVVKVKNHVTRWFKYNLTGLYWYIPD